MQNDLKQEALTGRNSGLTEITASIKAKEVKGQRFSENRRELSCPMRVRRLPL